MTFYNGFKIKSWTIIETIGEEPEVTYRCKCVCGNIKTFTQKELENIFIKDSVNMRLGQYDPKY